MAVKIVYQDVAPGAEADAAVTSSDAQDLSTLSSVPAGVTPLPIITGEPGMWRLDGTYQPLDSQPLGFWSTAMSDADGVFAAAPVLRVTFGGQYTTLGITLQFWAATGDWCSQVTIRWYKAGVLLESQVFTPTSATYFCEHTVQAFDAVEIQCVKTNKAFRYARISRVLFGIIREFGEDEIRSGKVKMEINPISLQMAINTMDWTLQSKASVPYIFQKKQQLQLFDDDALVCVFYIDKSEQTDETLYDINSDDACGVLDGSEFGPAIYFNVSARTVLESIAPGFEIELDAEIEAETITGYLPKASRRNCLQQAALALRAVVDTAGSSKIKAARLQTSGTPISLTSSDSYVNGKVATSALVTAVKVTAHTYTQGDSGDDVIEVDGVKYVHTTAITTITNPDMTSNDLENIKPVDTCTLINPANVDAVAQAIYAYYQRRSTLKRTISPAGRLPGDYVSAPTDWGTTITGHLTKLTINLQDTSTADAEVLGT